MNVFQPRFERCLQQIGGAIDPSRLLRSIKIIIFMYVCIYCICIYCDIICSTKKEDGFLWCSSKDLIQFLNKVITFLIDILLKFIIKSQ